MKQEFNIQSWEIQGNTIAVVCEKDYIAVPVYIDKDKFEMWLLLEDKRVDSIEYGTQSHSFLCELEEYYSCNIDEDLYEFITTHPITYRDILRTNATKSILDAVEYRKSFRL